MRALALAFASSLLLIGGASAQQVNTAAATSVHTKSTADYLSEGYEVKGVVNNTYLILQKGDQALFCGSRDPSLTWANWAAETRVAKCETLSK
jgi:hypothetical protein